LVQAPEEVLYAGLSQHSLSGLNSFVLLKWQSIIFGVIAELILQFVPTLSLIFLSAYKGWRAERSHASSSQMKPESDHTLWKLLLQSICDVPYPNIKFFGQMEMNIQHFYC